MHEWITEETGMRENGIKFSFKVCRKCGDEFVEERVVDNPWYTSKKPISEACGG